MEDNDPIGVGVIIIDAFTGKILLGKRKNAYKSGMWGFPGGRLEKTEPLMTCAVRELLEETGVHGNEFHYVGAVRELQGNKNERGYNFIHFIFSCQDYSGTIETKEPDKCEGWEWFSLDALPKEILPGHKAAIDMYVDKSLYKDLV